MPFLIFSHFPILICSQSRLAICLSHSSSSSLSSLSKRLATCLDVREGMVAVLVAVLEVVLGVIDSAVAVVVVVVVVQRCRNGRG